MLYKIYTMIFDIDDQNEDKMYMVELLYTQKANAKRRYNVK